MISAVSRAVTTHYQHRRIEAELAVNMLGLADATPWIAKVVGWVDFEKPGDRAALEHLAEATR